MKNKVALLRSTEFLATASDAVLHNVAAALETIEARAGETIITKGESGKSMYVLARGRVRVHDEQVVFTHLAPGDVFGEMAALDSDVRSASVTAELDCVLYRLEQRALYALMATDTDAAKAVIGMMCHRQRTIVKDISRRTRDLQVLERELEIGRRIQAGFLPNTLPQRADWQVAAFFRAAREVAGDFYDAFELRETDRIGLVIGDVCDKGLGAALFMTLFRSLVRATLMAPEIVFASNRPDQCVDGVHGSESSESRALINTLTLTNNYVADTHGDSGMFASLFVALLDPRHGLLTYANCGHEAPIIFGRGGVKQRLAPTAPVVGVVPDIVAGVSQVHLMPGDTLLTFTDGVTEALGPFEARFGERPLLAMAHGASSPAELLSGIETALHDHSSGTPQFDDITMLAVRRAEDQ